jgi:RNA polymerase sigma-70 factor (ECF subfamily)
LKARELEKCINEFGTEIYRFCMKLCADKANADDLYQQTFLKALESSMELDWEQNPKALFFSFAYNLWKSEQRKNARRSALVPCVSFDDADEVLLRSGENIEENIFRQELIRETKKIIAGLPEKIRTPLTLYYLFEQPVDEIAREIKKPPGTIKSRLFKGRSLIKKRLEESGYGKQEP